MNKIVKDSEVGVSPTVEQSLLEAISAKYGVDKSNSDAEDERTNEEQQDACNKENETASVDCGINAPKIDEKKKRVKVCAGRGKKYRRSFEEDEDFVCDSEEEEDGDDDCTVKSFLFNLKRNVGEIKQESIDEVVRKGAEKVAVKGVKRKVREVVPRTVKTRKRFPVDELGGAKVELVKKEHYKDVDGNCKEGVKERVLNQRISPRMFMESVIPGMPESHKAAIRDIGFGGFLYLDLDTHKSSFARELVMSFDPDRCSLILHKDQEIDVSKEDVHLVYGLPLGGKEIQEFQGTDDDEEFWDFLSKWRALFEIERGSPRNSVVIKEIQRLKKEPLCEAFLLHFVLCAVNCCIRSTNNSDLRFKFLYSCRDVSKISTLDWCGFVYKHLIESAIEWREGSSFFTGPLPFLQICYFDRLQRAKEEKPRKFPLISVWNKEMIRQRMVVETKRGFGKGLVLERIKYEDVVKNEAPQEEGKGLVLERIKYEDVVKN
ncbi:hypothetical protein M5689_001842 [Euphorbia peplus]|nr:hypothetical protein M5689_001842 [Euphorbia peplus]